MHGLHDPLHDPLEHRSPFPHPPLAPSAPTLYCRPVFRGVAQLGSASAWGAEGPRFKSGRPDHVQRDDPNPSRRRLRSLGRTARRPDPRTPRVPAPPAERRASSPCGPAWPAPRERRRSDVLHPGARPPRGPGVLRRVDLDAGRHRAPRVRLHALHALGCDRCKDTDCRPAKERVLPPAIGLLLRDGDKHVRAMAAEVVGRWVHSDSAASTALIESRDRDPEPSVRKKSSWYAPGGAIHRRTARLASKWSSSSSLAVIRFTRCARVSGPAPRKRSAERGASAHGRSCFAAPARSRHEN